MRKQCWLALIAALLVGVTIPAAYALEDEEQEIVKLWDDEGEQTGEFLQTRVDGSTATVPMMKAVREKIGSWEAVEHSTTPVAYTPGTRMRPKCGILPILSRLDSSTMSGNCWKNTVRRSESKLAITLR